MQRDSQGEKVLKAKTLGTVVILSKRILGGYHDRLNILELRYGKRYLLRMGPRGSQWFLSVPTKQSSGERSTWQAECSLVKYCASVRVFAQIIVCICTMQSSFHDASKQPRLPLSTPLSHLQACPGYHPESHQYADPAVAVVSEYSASNASI